MLWTKAKSGKPATPAEPICEACGLRWNSHGLGGNCTQSLCNSETRQALRVVYGNNKPPMFTIPMRGGVVIRGGGQA